MTRHRATVQPSEKWDSGFENKAVLPQRTEKIQREPSSLLDFCNEKLVGFSVAIFNN